MIKLAVKISQPVHLVSFLSAINASGRRSIMRAVGNRFKEIAQQNFGTQGIDRPIAWPPYARNYPNGKRKGQPATLIETWGLRQSIRVMSVSQDEVVVGSDFSYAGRHQFGMPGRTPARPYFPVITKGLRDTLTPYAQQELEAVVVEKLNQALKR